MHYIVKVFAVDGKVCVKVSAVTGTTNAQWDVSMCIVATIPFGSLRSYDSARREANSLATLAATSMSFAGINVDLISL